MKNLKNVMSVVALALVMLVSFNVGAQEKKTEPIVLDPGNSTYLTPQEFEQSVVMIHDFSNLKSRDASVLQVVTVEIVNFNKEKTLAPYYVINEVEYSDNGKFNDKRSGDGIYTSVKTHKIKLNFENNKAETLIASSKSREFSYDLKTNSKVKPGGSFGCDLYTAPCPQDSWYNQCYFSDECSCVYVKNCSFEISI